MFVHPATFGSMIRQEPAIVEYQVRQTPRGACILAQAAHSFDHEALAVRIEAALSGLGLGEPEVTIECAPQIARGLTGKLVRFVPLRAR
jgi:hypothetical protein